MFRGTAYSKKLVLIAGATILAVAAACGEGGQLVAVGTSTAEPTAVSPEPTRVPGEPTPEATRSANPTPEATKSPGSVEPVIYKLGIFEEPATRNYWSFWGGPGSTVWTSYVLEGVSTSLFTYSDQRLDWVPLVADDFPTELTLESIGGIPFWTTEVDIKEDATWSDGVDITSDDLAFMVDTVLDLQLGGNFGTNVNPDFVDHIEAISPKKAKIFFSAADSDGLPQRPGLSVWQFGLAFIPILPKHYWEPIVAEAKAAGDDIDSQQEWLFSYDPIDEPTAGGFVFKKWEPGAFYENEKTPDWYRSGVKITEYANGAYREQKNGYDATYYGEATGPIELEFEVGPHVQGELFNIYGDQDAAILALAKGDVDYVFNPMGLEKGFQEQIQEAADLNLVSNPSNAVRYLGFNVRKAPMDNSAFRKAVAVLIDKEFVTSALLQDAVFPSYSMVPPGNGTWHNPDVPKLGQGLDRAERVTEAVRLLKEAGFTFDVEPRLSEDGSYVEVQGKGLKMPDGNMVEEMEILAPVVGYDPMRSVFAVWIERWLTDAGIPTKATLTGFDVIVDALFSDDAARDLDMWILGWTLPLFPDYLELYFHSGNANGDLNFGGYSNKEFDALAAELTSAMEVEAAREKVFMMQEHLAEDLPYVMLFSPSIQDAYRGSVLNFPYTDVLGGLQSFNGLQTSVRIE